ncbi:MAG: alpha/beta hydrolase [Bacteroidetes bacterium]|nr:alpha/beta hydrolase [Bacteroidota bacterium]
MATSKFIEFKNTPIRYTSSGKGRAVVLLHGFLESSAMWTDVVKKLARTNRVITIDLLGHGETPSIGYVHTMELIAASVKHVLDKLKLRKYVLIGHSMGGYVALAFAELHSNNLAGIGLFHSTGQPDTEEKKKNRDRAIAAVKANHIHFIDAFFANLFAPENVDRLAIEISKMSKEAQNMSKQSIVNALEGMKIRKSREHVLKNSTLPILFILGKQDSRIDYEEGLKEVRKLKNTTLLSLENAGHMGFLEAKEECISAIKKFVSKCYKA